MSQISPEQAAPLLELQDCIFLDVREADEYARAHIPGSSQAPLSALSGGDLPETGSRQVILLCQSGARSEQARQILAGKGIQAQSIQGGLNAWKKAGLPMKENRKAPISIMRQVQMIAGSLVLSGALMEFFVAPGFLWLSAAVGAGLLFAGLSGTCMMANLLACLPYNKIRS